MVTGRIVQPGRSLVSLIYGCRSLLWSSGLLLRSHRFKPTVATRRREFPTGYTLPFLRDGGAADWLSPGAGAKRGVRSEVWHYRYPLYVVGDQTGNPDLILATNEEHARIVSVFALA
jgi:hypothetical protein